MNFFHKNDVSPVHQEFPKYKSGNIFSYLFGICVWILFLIVSLFVLYVQWFARNAEYLIALIFHKHTRIPFWFSALFVLFFSPLSLFIILTGTLVKIIKD